MTDPVTPEFREEVATVLEAAINDMDTGETDYYELMWLPLASGQSQPVLWPMRLHVHGKDCARA